MNKKHKFKYIYIEITNSCNLKCPFCPSATLSNRQFMNIEQFQQVIDNIKDYTKIVYLHILGEPLLHPLFKDFLRICKEANLEVRLTTNGSYLLSEAANIVEPISKINISLQSLINYSKDRQQAFLEELTEFIHLIKQRLVDKSLAIDFRLWNDKNDVTTLKLNEMLRNYLSENIMNLDLAGLRISEADEFIWPDLSMPINQSTSICLGGKTQMGILVDGTVVLCCLDYLGESNLGNIFHQSMEEILDSSKYQKIMEGFMAKQCYLPICKRCLYRDRFLK